MIVGISRPPATTEALIRLLSVMFCDSKRLQNRIEVESVESWCLPMLADACRLCLCIAWSQYTNLCHRKRSWSSSLVSPGCRDWSIARSVMTDCFPGKQVLMKTYVDLIVFRMCFLVYQLRAKMNFGVCCPIISILFDFLWYLMVFDGLWWLFSVLFVNGIDSVHSPLLASSSKSSLQRSPLEPSGCCGSSVQRRPGSSMKCPGGTGEDWDSQEIIGDPDEIQLPSTSYIFLVIWCHLMSLVIISPVTQCYQYATHIFSLP